MRHYKKLLTNARVGNNRFRNYIGRHGENINNKNGEKLLKIMNTFLNIKIAINTNGQQENINQ
jgi:hypothetical protein